jgi:hypothetical protein
VAIGINQPALRINPARTYEQEYGITVSYEYNDDAIEFLENLENSTFFKLILKQ